MADRCGVTEQLASRAEARAALQTNKPYYFIRSVPPGFSVDQMANAIDKAAKRWTDAGVNVTMIRATDEAEIGPDTIVDYIDAARMSSANILADQTLGNGSTKKHQMRVNTRVDWSQTDLVTVLCHELGHLWGLAHFPPGPPPEIMEPSISTITKPQPTEIAVAKDWFKQFPPIGPVPEPDPGPPPTPTPTPDPWPNCCRGVLGFNQAFNHIRHNRERIMSQIPRLTAAEARDVLAFQQAVAEVAPPWLRNYLVLAQRAAALPCPKIIELLKGFCPTDGAPVTPINWVEVLVKLGTMLLCPTSAVESAALTEAPNQG